MTSHEHQERQRQADKAHHEDRIAWLSAEHPVWACGTPIPRYLVNQMLAKSREALRLIVDHGMSTNSAPFPDN